MKYVIKVCEKYTYILKIMNLKNEKNKIVF